MSRLVVVCGLLLSIAACANPVNRAVAGPVDVMRGEECRVACTNLGMELTQVVLIMNSAGCVCQVAPTSAPGSSTAPAERPAPQAGGAATAAGGAAIAAVAAEAQRQAAERARRTQEEEAQQQQQQQQQQQLQQQHRH